MSKKTVLDCPDEANPADSDFLYLIKGLSDRKIKLSVLKNFFLTPLKNVPNWSGDTSTALGTSDVKIPSQKAVKVYVDNAISSLQSAILGIVHPVGDDYLQLPDGKTPSQKGWPGTWENVSSENAGEFYRIEGGNALAFGSGQQADQFQGHFHDFFYEPLDAPSGGTVDSVRQSRVKAGRDHVHNPKSDGVNGPPRTGSETRPINRTIRKWRRTA